MTMVKNYWGVEIDLDVAVNLMDDDLREDLIAHNDYETEQEFFDDYCEAHEAKYGDEFELAKENPVY